MKKLLLSLSAASLLLLGLSGCSGKTAATPQEQEASDYAKGAQNIDEQRKIEKNGFLTTKWCAQNDYFTGCPLETYVCGYKNCWKDYEVGQEPKTELVLFVHDEMGYYNVQASDAIHMDEFEELAFGKNDVTLRGTFDPDSNTITAKGFDAPPPPKEEFYKGCL
ncbi:MAG: hypothetical protein ACQERK_03400 [Campylobacterota bacterium]